MPNSNEYMKHYMADRRKKRRNSLLVMAGGKCCKCESTTFLEFDHIDPTLKAFQLDKQNMDRPWDVILEEFSKCQLLCRDCHVRKSVEEGSFTHGMSGRKGFDHSCAKLNEGQAREAFRLRSEGLSHQQIADVIGNVSRRTIGNLLNGKTHFRDQLT